jgi:uncharacterized protein (DUF1015 family)
MPRIRPFRGLRYDTRRVDAGAVMAPPYDVVDDAQRGELAARSPDNCIHFILPAGEGDSRYAIGGATFREQAARAMVRDEAPAIYVYHQDYEVDGEPRTRKGFMALVELTRFGAGPILAHERTLAGPKADRLALMRACEAHLELVFGMFSDPQRRWEKIVGGHTGDAVVDAEFEGIRHTLWKVDDAGALEALQQHLDDMRVYIADGHHRYETMCTYSDELAARGHADARWGLIYLSNLDDPGLTVLPTHRMVHGLRRLGLSALLDEVGRFFDVVRAPLPTDAKALREWLRGAGEQGAAFALAQPGSGEMAVLSLRRDFDPVAAGLGGLPPALQRLDVVLLHELVIERGLGIGKPAQEAKTNLRYDKSTAAALQTAWSKESDVQLVCFMNATPVSDVRAVCDSGHVMPQKSTYFYPKIPNGLVFHDLRTAP